MRSLMLVPLLLATAGSTAPVPTVPIAPGLRLPLINDGVSNRSLWVAAGGRGTSPPTS